MFIKILKVKECCAKSIPIYSETLKYDKIFFAVPKFLALA